MTFKYFNPKTGRKIWKSTKADGFTPLDNEKRSTKSSAFTVSMKDLPDGSQEYMIQANLDKDVQLMYSMKRPAAAKGWKLGNGERGGFSYFGENVTSPAGYVVHRFWPYAVTSGLIVLDGAAIDANGQGAFVHAIQGMRPNLVAARWNFCTFQSPEQDGVSALLMEFTTTSDYGICHVGEDGVPLKRASQIVTIGSLVHKGELLAVVAGTRDLDAPEDAPPRQPSEKPAGQPVKLDIDSLTISNPSWSTMGPMVVARDASLALRFELLQTLLIERDIQSGTVFFSLQLANAQHGNQ